MKSFFFFLLLTIPLSACQRDDGRSIIPEGNPDKPSLPNVETLRLSINGQSFVATLADNPAVTALKKQLPLSFQMEELHGNEKYYYLPGTLPTAPFSPGTIHQGDLFLFGSNCLVLFYESFSTSYSYTPLGRIIDPSGLATAVGKGAVSVSLELVPASSIKKP